MSTAVSLVSRQVRVHVYPTPTTLSETSAILKALQSFGPVTHFLNPRHVPALKSLAPNRFYVHFKESEARQKARLASPLTVDVGHDAVDPEEADPFNVRGFWDRKKVDRKTFKCEVYPDARAEEVNSAWNRRMVEANPYHGPFRVDRLAASFQDLMRQGAPSPEFADCFQKRQVGKADKARFEQKAQLRSFYRTAHNGEVTGGLMYTWRENLGSEAANGQTEPELGKPQT